MSFGLKTFVSRAMMTTSANSANHIFLWKHEGKKVQLAGTFNGWQPADMEKSDETWHLNIPVSFGRHEFKFVVDGKWIHDTDEKFSTNDHGSFNNVIEVTSDSNGNLSKQNVEPKSSDEDEDDWEIVQKPDVLEKLPAKQSTLEIERKFVVPENFRSLLENHGFQVAQALEENLQDKYFDTADHHLLHMDYWLRQRNGDWELKYPVSSQHSADGSLLYHETSNVDDILARIRGILPTYVDGFEVFGGEIIDNIAEHRRDLNELVENGTIKSFAQLDTQRQWFQKGDISIVIDDTDWGYRIGEIEILVSDSSEISKAVEKIEQLAQQLHFSDFDMVALADKVCAKPSSTNLS